MSRFTQHVPDILDCLAQLSNDEVPTSPKLACAMLDLLPEHVWHEPHYRWLNPFSKSGVFLRKSPLGYSTAWRTGNQTSSPGGSTSSATCFTAPQSPR